MDKIHGLDAQINDILGQLQLRKTAPKPDHPAAGSGPARLCKVMSSRPKPKALIAEKTGLAVSTVTAYLNQYNCFESAGRGKGYIYKKPKP